MKLYLEYYYFPWLSGVMTNLSDSEGSSGGGGSGLFTSFVNFLTGYNTYTSSYDQIPESTVTATRPQTNGDAFSYTSAIMSLLGFTEKSNATFRFTNSKGELDPKLYPNGWKGNGSVKPTKVSSVGNKIKLGGNILSLGSAGFSFIKMINASTTLDAIGHGVDGGMDIVGISGPYGLAASLYYSNVMKSYPAIRNSVNQQLVERADMMQRGFIPVGHPGFPFR